MDKLPLILLVDDDDQVRRAVERLIRLGYGDQVHARAFVSPHEALKPDNITDYKTHPKVMVISDGNMPDMDGPELIAKLRQELGPRLTRRVLMSGRLEDHLPKLQDLDVVAFEKPMHPDLLRAQINRFLLI